MSQAKNNRAYKRQKGQFLTPQVLAREILADVEFDVADRVLEPGFGDGSFLLPMIEAFLELYEGPVSSRLDQVLNNNIWGVEIDPVMYDKALLNIEERIGPLPVSHNPWKETSSRRSSRGIPCGLIWRGVRLGMT